MEIVSQSTSDYILEISKEYAVHVCESRAIPKLADGLKDSQRKMLWIIRNRLDKIKTISLAGLSISENLYLGGDQSASDTISMLAAPFCNNIPLLEGIGSFGTRTAPTGWGAARYTYVKRGKAATELLYPDLDIVPVKENYDGSSIEPIHFLPLIPIALLNGISGIAVGWSSEILPRSFHDIIDASLAALNNKPLSKLVPKYQYLACHTHHIEDNTWEFTGKVTIIDSSTIKVTELPPDLTLTRFKERLNGYEDLGKINSYTDRSTKTIDITIKFLRGSIKEWTENEAIDFLKLRQRQSERIVVINWNGKSIRQYATAEDVVVDFVNWRLQWYNVRYQAKLDADQYELKYWQAIKCCFDANLPARLGGKANREQIELDVKSITANIGIDDKQIDRIVSLATYKWALDFYQIVLDNIRKLSDNIALNQKILSDPKMIKDIYRTELQALKKLRF